MISTFFDSHYPLTDFGFCLFSFLMILQSRDNFDLTGQTQITGSGCTEHGTEKVAGGLRAPKGVHSLNPTTCEYTGTLHLTKAQSNHRSLREDNTSWL